MIGKKKKRKQDRGRKETEINLHEGLTTKRSRQLKTSMCQRTRWSPAVFLQLWPFEAVTSFKSGIHAVRTHYRKGGLGSRVSTEL